MPTLIYRRYVHEGPHVTPNVFHEHAVYLRYICAFYDELPALSLFVHGHKTSWHNRRRVRIRKVPALAHHLRPASPALTHGVRHSVTPFVGPPVTIRGHRRTPPVPTQLRSIDLRKAASEGGVYKSFNDVQQCWRDGEALWRVETAAQVGHHLAGHVDGHVTTGALL